MGLVGQAMGISAPPDQEEEEKQKDDKGVRKSRPSAAAVVTQKTIRQSMLYNRNSQKKLRKEIAALNLEQSESSNQSG